jgi:hypothetical protein
MLAAALVLAAGNQAHAQAQGGKLLDRVPTPATQPSATGTTRVTIVLVRADQARETVDTARQGRDEPHYRGPVTTWPFGLAVDGKHEFDERDAKGQIVRRLTSVTLDLSDGEHAIDSGGHKFRLARGKVESLSPELLVHENRVALRLHPVTFTTAEDQGPAVPVWVRLAWKGRELWRNSIVVHAMPLTLYLPATSEGGYESNVSPKRRHMEPRLPRPLLPAAATWLGPGFRTARRRVGQG